MTSYYSLLFALFTRSLLGTGLCIDIMILQLPVDFVNAASLLAD